MVETSVFQFFSLFLDCIPDSCCYKSRTTEIMVVLSLPEMDLEDINVTTSWNFVSALFSFFSILSRCDRS